MRPSNIVFRISVGIGLLFGFLLAIGLFFQVAPNRQEPQERREERQL
jgi:hypothetical protein